MEGIKEACLNAGMTEYVSKPVDWVALSLLLARLREDEKQADF